MEARRTVEGGLEGVAAEEEGFGMVEAAFRKEQGIVSFPRSYAFAKLDVNNVILVFKYS